MVRIFYLVCVFEWCKRFFESWDSTEDDQYPSRSVSVSAQTVIKINEIVRGDCHMSIWVIAETVNINKETDCLIFVHHLCLQSPSLSPADYFLWGYLKDRVYRNQLKLWDQLRQNITAEVNVISLKML